MSDRGQSKTWVCTIHNYTERDIAVVTEWATWCKQIVFTKEVGEETGHLHLQGYVVFPRAMTLKSLKKIHPTATWKIGVAAELGAIYCLKLDSEKVINQNNTCQGKRKDITDVYDSIEAGLTTREFVLACKPGIQAIATWKAARFALAMPRAITDLDVIWNWGPTGCGKTHWAYENYPDLFSVETIRWWDGYEGEETILFDEFRADQMPWSKLLKLTDKYPMRVETKGSWVQVQYLRVIITAPEPPHLMYAHIGEDVAQLLRRITQVNHFPNRFTEQKAHEKATATATEVG